MMPIYNTILFGNGLTTALFNQIRIKKLVKKSEGLLCDINDRVCSLIGAPVDSPTYRKVLPLFGIFGRDVPNYQQIISEQKASKRALIPLIPEIREYGLEYCISKHLFESDTKVQENFTFLYLLYNFWYRGIEDSILTKHAVIELLKEVAHEFSTQFDDILTLNFDLLLDNNQISHPLSVQHIHGKFIERLNNYGDLQYFMLNKGQQFEYPYLFGSNAIEKLNRLKNIQYRVQHNSSCYYNLDFLFNDEKDWGNLLIYGVSFLPTEIFTDEFFDTFPQYHEIPGDMRYYFTHSLDGHILYRIQELIKEEKICHVSIAYHSEKDRKQYENLLGETLIAEHLSLVQCNDVFFSQNLKNLLGY